MEPRIAVSRSTEIDCQWTLILNMMLFGSDFVDEQSSTWGQIFGVIGGKETTLN
jgi:hypothetical protein